MPPFEIKYLAISWTGPDEVSKLDASHDSVLLQQNGGWFAETTTFPAVHHYIGIRITASDTQHAPYIIMANGVKQQLAPVKAPGEDVVWWIQSEGWHKKSCRHLSSVYRTSGRIQLIVQGETLTIENHTANFTVSELEYYLNDFKDSLWMLILDNNSVLQGKVNKESPDYIDLKVMEIFQKFTESVENIVRKPAMVLNETIAKRTPRKTRPMPRTFRELAINPNAKVLTSRANLESYNTPENRYVYHCVKRVQYVLSTLERVARGQINAYQQTLEQESSWLDSLSVAGTKIVDSDVFDYEIAQLQSRLVNLQNETRRRLITSDYYVSPVKTELRSYTVELTQSYAQTKTSFFASKLNGNDFKQQHGTFLVVTFPEDADTSVVSALFSHYEIKLTGQLIRQKKTTYAGDMYYEISFETITDVEISSQELARMRKRRFTLEQSNWVTTLSREEKEDIERERVRAIRKAKILNNLIDKASVFLKQAPAIKTRLLKLKNFFEQHKVKSVCDFPNSMVFIQNSHYASAKSQYSKLASLNGLDELMLNALTSVESIGLVNISNLYEKWCLVKIIDVLVSKLQLEIESGWQDKLIRRVLNKDTDIALKLSDSQRQLHLIFTYEKNLDSGKRPDFTLELEKNNYRRVSDQDGHEWEFEGSTKCRLLLDAKFRGNINQDHVDELVKELYHTKNYSEDGANQVFVLHPCAGVITRKSSPLVWGKYCDYGHSNSSNHRFGSIFLSPSITYLRSVENLERLLGMFIQSNSVILEKSDSLQPSWHNISCISCGCSESGSLSIKFEPTKKGNSRWIIECSECSLRTIKTRCIGCKQSIFKNGPKWTYHKTRAEQISNIVCPSCEQYLTPFELPPIN